MKCNVLCAALFQLYLCSGCKILGDLFGRTKNLNTIQIIHLQDSTHESQEHCQGGPLSQNQKQYLSHDVKHWEAFLGRPKT